MLSTVRPASELANPKPDSAFLPVLAQYAVPGDTFHVRSSRTSALQTSGSQTLNVRGDYQPRKHGIRFSGIPLYTERPVYENISEVSKQLPSGYRKYQGSEIRGEANFQEVRNILFLPALFLEMLHRDPFGGWEHLKSVELSMLRERAQEVEGPDFSDIKFVPSRRVPGRYSETFPTVINFQKVRLANANFESSHFPGANFMNAILVNASFRRTYLVDAQFIGAILPGADFAGANLTQANFAESDLSEVRNLDRATLTNAYYSRNTRFPPGFDPEAHGMVGPRSRRAMRLQGV